jgi:hypothetical protein
LIGSGCRNGLIDHSSYLSEGSYRSSRPETDQRVTVIVALARKLIIALWRFATTGEPLEGVVLREAVWPLAPGTDEKLKASNPDAA